MGCTSFAGVKTGDNKVVFGVKAVFYLIHFFSLFETLLTPLHFDFIYNKNNSLLMKKGKKFTQCTLSDVILFYAPFSRFLAGKIK